MTWIRTLARGAALLAIAIIRVPLTALIVAGVTLSFLLGMVFFFAPAIRLLRRMVAFDRRLVFAWTGVTIDTPYLPRPDPPVRQSDGYFHSAGHRYRSSLIPVFNLRLNWLMSDPATWRDLIYLIVDPWTRAVLAGGPVLLAAFAVVEALGGRYLSLIPAALYLAVAPWALHAYAFYVKGMLGLSTSAHLEGKVRSISQARSAAVDSQATELRRIERDLHDGAQARLVAVGMTIGAAEQLLDTNPDAARALLVKAREASGTALAELRRLVRGIHPPVLAERGLPDAVRALALDSPLKVKVTVDMHERPESPVESAVYFTVNELLANASRVATQMSIDISRRGGTLRVVVADDGPGGAVVTPGGGLAGIERRLAAFDGVLALHSPPGGPTTATIEVPNALPYEEPNKLSRPRIGLIALCWSLCWIPLFPQGIVASIMLATGTTERSWFLAMHMPSPFNWLTAAGMIGLGCLMLGWAMALSAEHPPAVRL